MAFQNGTNIHPFVVKFCQDVSYPQGILLTKKWMRKTMFPDLMCRAFAGQQGHEVPQCNADSINHSHRAPLTRS